MGSTSSRSADASRLRSTRRERSHASDAHSEERRRSGRGRQVEEVGEGSSRDHFQIEISRGSAGSGGAGGSDRCSCGRESVIVEVDNSRSPGDDEEKQDGGGTDEEVDRSEGSEELGTSSSSSSSPSSSSSSSSSPAPEIHCSSSSSETGGTNLSSQQQQQQQQETGRDATSDQFLDHVPVDLAQPVDPSGRESRRNSGRRFWDALTRAASHRRSSASPITIVAIEEIDDNGSSTSRWNFQHWRSSSDVAESAGESGGGRIMDLVERRRHVRSHVWALQRLSGGLQISHGHARSCPAAGQFDANCSCDSHGTEDSSTRASISRIIMLAEALFEVLDEIHRQSVALSQSASMPLALLPAPDTVVNLIPVRAYEKSDVASPEEAAQCHICLVEYEEGDQIRVLPCQHEYHQACVDKWLKEVHRVCPLCRRNVCSKGVPAGGTAEAL